jgi:hypothetical protein
MITHFLAADKIRLCYKDDRLWFKMDGQKVALAAPRRALPLSQPDEYIVLSDQHGNEVGVLRRIEDLDSRSQDNLRRALSLAYQVTRILRVLQVEREPISGQVRWRVEVETLEDPGFSPGDFAVPSRTEDNESTRGRFQLLRRNAEDQPLTEGRQLEFRIAGAEDVQTARYPHIYIHDTDGNRYEIQNCEALDIDSRRAAERYF